MSTILPIADTAEMRRQALALAGRHRRAMIGVVVLHALAAATGLVGPPLLGSLVQGLQTSIDTAEIDRVVAILAVFLVAQTVLTFFARRSSFVLSERMFAELRDDFMRRVLALPLSTVERAGIGDLVSRTTADVDALARTIRFAIPETSIACVTALLVVVAAVWVSPIAALPCLVGVPILSSARAGTSATRRAATSGSAPRTPRSRARPVRRSTAAAPSSRSASPASAPAGSTPTSPTPTRRSASRSGCARSGSRPSTSPTCCRSSRRSPGAAGSSRRATPRSAR